MWEHRARTWVRARFFWIFVKGHATSALGVPSLDRAQIDTDKGGIESVPLRAIRG
jgi:hypothetical protein